MQVSNLHAPSSMLNQRAGGATVGEGGGSVYFVFGTCNFALSGLDPPHTSHPTCQIWRAGVRRLTRCDL